MNQKKRPYKTGFTSSLSISMTDEMYLNIVEAASKRNMRETEWIRMILQKYFEILEKRKEQDNGCSNR